MSTLPPLSNFFAIFLEAPQARDAMRKRMEDSGEFDELWEPAPGWLVGQKQLPLNKPVPEAARKNGFVFAEGALAMTGDRLTDAESFYRNLGAFVDSTPEKLSQYPGDFTFLRFRTDGTVTAVRACAGLAPLYFSDDHKVFSTRLKWMRSLGGFTSQDLLPLAMWASSTMLFPDGRTFFKQVSCLEHGCYRKSCDAKIHFYWDPLPRVLPPPSAELEEEHAVFLRNFLIKHLSTNLDPGGSNLLTLSGGVDSSCLAALSSKVLGLPPATLSCVPITPKIYDYEIQFIRNIRKSFNIQRNIEVVISHQQRFESMTSLPDVGIPVPHPALVHLFSLPKESLPTVMFGGEFADEVVGSHFTLPDWAAMVSPFYLFGELLRGRASLKDFCRLIKQKAIWLTQPYPLRYPKELPHHIDSNLKVEYSNWWKRRQKEGNKFAPKFYFHQCYRDVEYLAMNWEALSYLGIRRCSPFYNREIIEFACTLHPQELVVPRSKKILRKALERDVPSLNLNRQSKGIWGPIQGKMEPAWLSGYLNDILLLLQPEFQQETCKGPSVDWTSAMIATTHFIRKSSKR